MSFQQLDNPFDGGGLTPPPGYVVPSFPSLYDPRFDFGDNDPNNPPPGTYYLYNSFEIYRFTLYWTLIFYASSFALCGTFALLVRGLAKRRAPKLFVTVVLAFILTGTFFAVVGSAIVGYVLAAIYSVGYFSMSTWVPFLWALILTLVAVMGSYSTVIVML
ncbi:integral membrane family protein [Rhizoctonia solani]|uniref:Integral membrane family protein n=2 Tax=Rhizoctonia solani TaxID=456999 RepID=A0A8H8SU95_9AGAM|nr:integral membrane family protein [Rhizoctonia solani]QRW17142.1 integral membrane family protein [Rhizoctonia solani]